MAFDNLNKKTVASLVADTRATDGEIGAAVGLSCGTAATRTAIRAGTLSACAPPAAPGPGTVSLVSAAGEVARLPASRIGEALATCEGQVSA